MRVPPTFIFLSISSLIYLHILYHFIFRIQDSTAFSEFFLLSSFQPAPPILFLPLFLARQLNLPSYIFLINLSIFICFLLLSLGNISRHLSCLSLFYPTFLLSSDLPFFLFYSSTESGTFFWRTWCVRSQAVVLGFASEFRECHRKKGFKVGTAKRLASACLDTDQMGTHEWSLNFCRFCFENCDSAAGEGRQMVFTCFILMFQLWSLTFL